MAENVVQRYRIKKAGQLKKNLRGKKKKTLNSVCVWREGEGGRGKGRRGEKVCQEPAWREALNAGIYSSAQPRASLKESTLLLSWRRDPRKTTRPSSPESGPGPHAGELRSAQLLGGRKSTFKHPLSQHSLEWVGFVVYVRASDWMTGKDRPEAGKVNLAQWTHQSGAAVWLEEPPQLSSHRSLLPN